MIRRIIDPNLWSRWKLRGFLAVASSLWAIVAFVSLDLFFVPCMDNWCYFAPSATARWPGDLSTPFLGSFGGADRIWGLHWPGVPLLNSIPFSILPASPWLYVVWHLLLWLGVGSAASWLTWLVSKSRLATVAAFLFVLCDRALCFIASWQRMELLSLIIASPLVAGLIRQARREKMSRAQFGLCLAVTFLAPLTHPIAGALTMATIAIAWWLGIRAKTEKGQLFLQIAVFVASVGALLGWFVLRPELFAQFKDHVGVAKTPFVPGEIFLNSMREIYFPLITGPLFYGGGLLLAVTTIKLSWPRANEAWNPERDVMWVLACLALAIAAALNIFRNAYYLVFLFLPLCPLFALAARQLTGDYPFFAHLRRETVAAILLVLICIHGAFWFTRSLKWAQASFPNLRHELRGFWANLPACRHLYIPEALWEEAVQNPKPGTEILMNTIINNSSLQRRRAYETYAYTKVQPGDLVVLDDCQSNHPLTAPDPNRWALVRTVGNHPPGRIKWGYGFTVYRAH